VGATNKRCGAANKKRWTLTMIDNKHEGLACRQEKLDIKQQILARDGMLAGGTRQ